MKDKLMVESSYQDFFQIDDQSNVKGVTSFCSNEDEISPEIPKQYLKEIFPK